MLAVIDGPAGAGKTFFISRLVKEAWDRGIELYPNFPLWYDEEHTNITRWFSLDDTYHIKNGIIVIDESVKVLDARRWRSLPATFAEKIAMHRHDHLDMYCLIQNINDIDIRIRTNVAILYSCESVFRFPRNQRVKPIFQIIKVVKKKKITSDNNRISWKPIAKYRYYLSRYWTKTYYQTYGKVGEDYFVCRIKLDTKKPKKSMYQVKIYARDLINQGKARL